MKKLLPVLALTVLVCTPCLADTLSFDEGRFSVDVPSGWKTMDPPPSGTVLVAADPEEKKIFFVSTGQDPRNAGAKAVREAVAGIKQGALDKGWQVLSEEIVSSGDVAFHVMTMTTAEGRSVLAYTGWAAERIVMLQGIDKEGDAWTDPQLQAILKSFRLVEPKPAA